MESNSNTTFYNSDQSKSFNQSLTTALAGLSAHVCSEVVLINRTGQDVYIYDNDYTDDGNRLLLLDDESMILRGITNTSSVSAKTSAGTGTLYYRAQMFSNMISK